MRFVLFALAAVGGLVPVAPLVAQSRDTTHLSELIVTANRAPTALRHIGSSVDQLRPEELDRRQLRSLREALQLLPGGPVLVSGGSGAVTSLFLRGVAASQTLLLLDGIRVNDANAAYGSVVGGLDLTGLGRLEVVRGPQSILYGGAAIGGVISIDAAPGAGRPAGFIEAEGGSFASWHGRASAHGGSGRLGVAASLTANQTDNERRPNDWDQRTQLFRVDYRASDALRLGATFRGLQQTFRSPGDVRTTNTTPVSRTEFDNNLGTVWIEAQPTAQWRARLVAGLAKQFTRDSANFDGFPSSFTIRHTRKVLDWQNTFVPGGNGKLLLIAGATREWSTGSLDAEELEERLWGAYVEAQALPVTSLSVTAGIRVDDYNTFARDATYRLTGAWLVERTGSKLRASFGTGFMPPSLSARFGSVYQNANPEIRPERSRGWDAGIDQSLLQGRGTLSITYFRNSLRDLIGFESATFPEKGRNINVDRARTSGLELSGRLAAGPVDARLGYTLLSARSLSESDASLARLIRRPRHTASADVAIAIGGRGALGAGLVLMADREDTDFNSFPSQRVNPGDYAVARIHGSWELSSRLTLRSRIENLFDERYEPVYGFPALGRSLTASAAFRF